MEIVKDKFGSENVLEVYGSNKNVTKLARNKWICWVISVKKDESRRVHIKRTVNELKEGVVGHAIGQVVLIVSYFQLR